MPSFSLAVAITETASVSPRPFLVLAASVLFLIAAIAWVRMHPFLALIAAALLVGWTSGGEAGFLVDTVDSVSTYFGQTVAKIGLVIALAALLGMSLQGSGAADRIALRFVALFGSRRAPLALMVSGFVLSIPVFFDTVFFLLVPIAATLARRTGQSYMVCVLAIGAGGAITHSVVPPTPGPLTVAAQLDLSISTATMAGLAAGVLPAALALLTVRWLARRIPLDEPRDEADTTKMRPEHELPGFTVSILPIALPVVLISLAGVLESAGVVDGLLATLVTFLGHKVIALALGLFVAIALHVRAGNVDRKTFSEQCRHPLETAGLIILITGAGGAYGSMIGDTGIGNALASLAQRQSFALVPLAWLVTALVRIAQGSATVAMLTGVGLVAAIIEGSGPLPHHVLYLYLAIGFGSITCSWMNDSGFWIVGRLGGLTERETLRTWTPLSTVIGVLGGLEVWLLSSWFPLA